MNQRTQEELNDKRTAEYRRIVRNMQNHMNMNDSTWMFRHKIQDYLDQLKAIEPDHWKA